MLSLTVIAKYALICQSRILRTISWFSVICPVFAIRNCLGWFRDLPYFAHLSFSWCRNPYTGGQTLCMSPLLPESYQSSSTSVRLDALNILPLTSCRAQLRCSNFCLMLRPQELLAPCASPTHDEQSERLLPSFPPPNHLKRELDITT